MLEVLLTAPLFYGKYFIFAFYSREKYRDLLTAADTITDMRETSKNVVTCIGEVTKLCQALQEKHLLGFKTVEAAPAASR